MRRSLLWLNVCVASGGAGSFNMAFEAGPNVSMSPEVQGSAAAQLAVAHNLSDPFGYKQRVAFTALRVSESQLAGSVCLLATADAMGAAASSETRQRLVEGRGCAGEGAASRVVLGRKMERLSRFVALCVS